MQINQKLWYRHIKVFIFILLPSSNLSSNPWMSSDSSSFSFPSSSLSPLSSTTSSPSSSSSPSFLYSSLTSNSKTKKWSYRYSIKRLEKYVTKVRVSKAATLLSGSKLSIDEIAEQTGFPNRYYFSRVFKKMTNHSPADFRSNYRFADWAEERKARPRQSPFFRIQVLRGA